MDNKEEKVVFYGPLPVNKPCPIPRPNEKIQLQPTVNPVAIAPYISYGDEEETVAQSAGDKTEIAARKSEKRVSAMIGGIIAFIISLASILLFVFSFAKKYPIGAIEKYASLGYFADMFKTMFENKQFTQFSLVFVPYLIAVAYVAIAVNLVLSLVAVFTGKRRGYSLFAFIAFLALVVAAFYEMKFFSQIKSIGNLLTRECGWPCLMLIIIGCANLIFAWICGIICPKHKITETVEF